MSTIDFQNARQIRDPMQVRLQMQVAETLNNVSYAVAGSYKSYDSTLDNTTYSMRVLADLQGDGFLLDGSAEWYENKPASANNGKLGLRGDIGETITVTVSASPKITMLTVISRNVATISFDGTTIEATGVDLLMVDNSSATLTFEPVSEYERVEINNIMPGALFVINNDNLLKCTLALRSSLDPFATSLEASDIEANAYFSDDIGIALSQIANNWPITYSAGYSNQMSEERRFYLSEPATWQNGVLTIKGTDASVLLSKAQYETNYANTDVADVLNMPSFAAATEGLLSRIEDALGGIEVEDNVVRSFPQWGRRDDRGTIRREMLLSELLQRTMALTRNHSNPYMRLEYIDAGRPMLSNSEQGKGRYTVLEEDLSDIVYNRARNISKIVNTGDTYKYDQELIPGKFVQVSTEGNPVEKEQLYTVSVPTPSYQIKSAVSVTYPQISSLYDVENLRANSTEAVANIALQNVSASAETKIYTRYRPFTITGGVDSYDNPNGLPGEEVSYEPLVYGRIVYDGVNWLSPANLFKSSRDTIQFKFKGDPRWQPRDYVDIEKRDGSTETWQISEIVLEHEGGGTLATVTAWAVTTN